MLKHGILATNSIYTSISHTDDKLEHYFNTLDTCFSQIAKRFPEDTLYDKMDFEDSANGFQRLN